MAGAQMRAATCAGCARVAFLVLTSVSFGHAQDSRAAILGTVFDPSGAAVQGARIIATNLGTDVRYSAESTGSGSYVVAYLPPGAYRLRIEQEGFRAYEHSAIDLRTGDRVRIDVPLSVGRLADTIIVTADTSLIASPDASSGSVIDSRRIAELPVAHGNVYHLTQLSAGVAYRGNATLDRPFDPNHIANYSIAGAHGLRNEITLDGAPNASMTGGRNQAGAAYVPPADIIGEMKITTMALDASAGHTEGGVIGVSLKSGENTPHATAYYNHQGPSLFANSWLANRRGQPRPDFHYGRWGGSLLGPVVLPRLYNGTNRTFFLLGYEAIRERRPRNPGDQTVPGAGQREGNFSRLLELGPQYQLYDPWTRRRGTVGGIVSDPLAGNLIPRSRIHPIARAILGYFPLPNTPGSADGQRNFSRSDLAETLAYANHAWRVDHNVSARNLMFASAALYDRRSEYNDYFQNAATGETFGFNARRAAIDDVHVFSPRSVLNLRYSYNRFVRSADLNPASHGFDLTSLAPGNRAWTAWNNAIDPELRRFPTIDIAGYFNQVGASASGVLFRPQDTHSFAGSIGHARGQHTLKIGGEYRVYRKNEYNPYGAVSNGVPGGSATGVLTFGEDWTKGPTDTSAAPPIGAGLASLLLGLPTGGGITKRASFAEQSTVSSFYLHDEWRAARRIAVTLGIRYELEGPLTERFNRSVRGFDASAVLPVQSQIQANYAAIAALVPERPPESFDVRGGVTFAGVNGEPRTLYGRDVNNLMPRIGLAYSLDANTVIRAGYGMFFGGLGIRRGDVLQTGFSFTTPLVATEDNGLTFASTLDNPFPRGALNPPGSSLGAMTGAGDHVSYFNTGYVAPFMQRWQISVQRQAGSRTMLEVAYVGNRGSKLETTRNLNGIPLRYLSTRDSRDQERIDYLGQQDLLNPFYGSLPASSPIGGSKTVSRASLLTAFPQFTRLETTTNEGYSRYHSLQSRIEQRFSRGLTFTAAYTFSRFIDAISYLNDMDPAPHKVVSEADYPQRFSASWIYELPFGPGRAFAGSTGRLVSRIIGGWQVEGLYVYQSGSALAFGNIGFQGSTTGIPLKSSERSVDRWFNTETGFIRDSSQALAFNVRTFPMRLIHVRGPAMNNWDVSVLKITNLSDRFSLQLRGEFLNVMNHVWFSNPNTNPASTLFGSIASEQGYMRRVQLALKLIY
jgi:hypothetical protein